MSSVTTEPDPGLYGGASVDHQQGYRPMDLVPNEPAPPAEELPVADERDTPMSAEDAAKFLSESRQNRAAEEEAPPAEPPRAPKPIPREYQRLTGRDAGKPMPSNETVSAERAAADLGDLRTEERNAEQAAIDAELAQAVDQARTGEAQHPDQPHQAEQAAAEGSDVWQRPEVISAVSDYTNQVNAAYQQTQQQYAAQLQANSAAASATIFSAVPELQGISTPEQLQTALAVIERQDPARAQSIKAHIQNVSELAAKAQEVQQQQQFQQFQAHRQQFDQVASMADDAYDKWITKQEPDAGRRQQISATAQQMLREAGLSDQEMSYHWSTNPILRSFAGQQIMADAARYRMARQGVTKSRVAQVPTVMRPGSPTERASQAEYDMSKLSAKLSQDASPRSAAELLMARRRARGR